MARCRFCQRCWIRLSSLWLLDCRDPIDASPGPTVLGYKPGRASFQSVVRAIRQLVSPYFTDAASRLRAWAMLLLVFACMYWEVSMSIRVAEAVKEMQNELVDKSSETFWPAFWEVVKLRMLVWPIGLCNIAGTTVINLDWRRYLTERTLKLYVNKEQAFYRLGLQYGSVDNPDARIAQDIGSFTRWSCKLMKHFATDVFKIFMNSYALFQISRRLFYSLICFSLLYTAVSLGLFAGPLVRIQRRVLAMEANLRHVLMRLREHAESVAFFGGFQYERACCEKVLSQAIGAEYQQNGVSMLYHLVTEMFRTGLDLLPTLVVAPMFFSGQVTFGTIHQSRLLFKHLMSGMMDLGKELADIAKMGADSLRIQELWDALAALEREEVCKDWDSEKSKIYTDSDGYSSGLSHFQLEELPPHESLRLQVSELTLLPPQGGTPLLRNLNCSLHAGESLLIEGASGSGKSSLLRAIAGLWVQGQGRIRRTRRERCFFVPQSPYICLGSLRDNLLYPLHAGREGDPPPSEEAIGEVLESLGLSQLPLRFGMDQEAGLQP